MQGSQNWTYSTFTTLTESTAEDWHKNLLLHFTTNILLLPISSPISFSSSSLPEPLISRIQLKLSSTRQFRRIWRQTKHVAHTTVNPPALWDRQQRGRRLGELFCTNTKVEQQDTFKGYKRDGIALPPIRAWIQGSRRGVKARLSRTARKGFPLVWETAEIVHNRKHNTLTFYLSFWLL